MGSKRFGFPGCQLTAAKKKTKGEKFLFETEVVLMRQALTAFT